MSAAPKRRIGVLSTAGLAIITGVLVLVNLVSYQYFTRLDFTEDKIYSLSTAARRLLGALPDRVRVRVFFDEQLPPEYAPNRRYLRELLDEMSAASRGGLVVEFADMTKPESKEEAMRAGVPPLQFTAVRQDKFEVQEGMMGLAIYYEDKKEVIPAVTETRNLEYELVSRLLKLTGTRKPVIGWTTGQGEMEPPAQLRAYLSAHYDLRLLEDLESGPIEPVSSIVVVGPRRPFSDTALAALETTMRSGVPMALLVDQYDVHMGNFFARKVDHGLDRILQSAGVRFKEGLVADAQNVPVQVQSQQGFFTIQRVVHFPFIPRVARSQNPADPGLSPEHPVTRPLQEIALPFVSALEILDSSGVTVLARSTAESYRIAQPFVVSPMEKINVEGAEKGPFALGVSIQKNIRLMVLGNAGFLDEERGGGDANLTFASNLIDWLASSEDLISIRSKANTFRPLKNLSDDRRNLIKSANLFLMPLTIILTGIIRWQIRRVRRRRWEESLAS
ncbi:GldG family protein [bacterium]|nr:GldG family protein [bacterium]